MTGKKLLSILLDTVHDVYIGIDPGSNGAIAVYVPGRVLEVFDIPTYQVEAHRKKQVDKEILRLERTALRIKNPKTLAANQAKIDSLKESQESGSRTFTVSVKLTQFDYKAIIELFGPLGCIAYRIKTALEDVPTSIGRVGIPDVLLNRAWAMWPLYLTSLGFDVERGALRPVVWRKALGLKDKKTAIAKVAELFGDDVVASKVKIKPMERAPDRAEAILLAYYKHRVDLGDTFDEQLRPKKRKKKGKKKDGESIV